MQITSPIIRLAQIAGIFLASTAAIAIPIQSNSLLVTNLDSGVLSEYSRQGSVVQQFNIPDFGGGFHDLRGVTQGDDGRVHMFNGTFTPQMTTLDPVTGQIANVGMPGWSTVNNISYGGIGVFGSSVFVSDMFTFNGGEDQGIVQFNLANGIASRFGSATDYTDLTVGLDGLLYAYNGGIDVYDPITTQFIRTVTLQSSADVRGIAVNKAGQIFTAGWGGEVEKYDASGQQQGLTLLLGTSLTDIDVNATGDLVLGSRFGEVFLTTESLNTWDSFFVSGNFGPTVHAAFARLPIATVPESSTLFLSILGLGCMLQLRTKGRK